MRNALKTAAVLLGAYVVSRLLFISVGIWVPKAYGEAIALAVLGIVTLGLGAAASEVPKDREEGS